MPTRDQTYAQWQLQADVIQLACSYNYYSMHAIYSGKGGSITCVITGKTPSQFFCFCALPNTYGYAKLLSIVA